MDKLAAMSAEKDDKLFEWPPLESNPEVFTDYMHQVGLPSMYEIGDVYGFDEDLLGMVPQPVHAMVACYEGTDRVQEKKLGDAALASQVKYFMKQTGTLDNACGIIACLHAALNTPQVTIQISPESVLGKFYDTVKSESPMARCVALENNSEFKNIHRSFASRGQSAEISSDQSAVKCHYVAYILQGNKLLEMDGTKSGPHIVQEECTDVLRGTVAEIQRRLAAGEITDQISLMTLHTATEE